jgi:hypothetical protein
MEEIINQLISKVEEGEYFGNISYSMYKELMQLLRELQVKIC